MNNKLHRWVYWPIWFIIIPLVLSTLTVWMLGSGEDALPEGLLGRLRYFVQDQKVPAIIVFFTIYEMVLYQLRHSLPFASKLGMAGRPGLPKTRLRAFEQAGHVFEEAQRTLGKNRVAIKNRLGEEGLTSIEAAMKRLHEAMNAPVFNVETFDTSFTEALEASEKLAPWRRGELREYGESIFIAVAVALLLRSFLVEAFKIPSGSMLPTLQINDHIFVNKLSYGPTLPFSKYRAFADLPPERGDVVVFEFPDPNPNNPRTDYIKRVVAVPGDVLEVDGGHPILNGWRVPSCLVGTYKFGSEFGYPQITDLFVEFLGDVAYLTLHEKGRQEIQQGPYTVGPGEFWVMGDNRNNSLDSRAWRHGRGAGVPFENVKGKALFVWLSFNDQNQDFLGVTWDRLLTNVMGKPRLPKEAEEKLKIGIDRCLAERPHQTLPPPRPSAPPTR